MPPRSETSSIPFETSKNLFFVILGVMSEDVWDDDELGVVTSTEWTMIGGGSIGGAVLVLLAIRGIGWVVSGFLAGDKKASADADQPLAEIAHPEQDAPNS